MAFQSPQLGYNTNVRHHGDLFHIQTEDSGARHPHVITHLFADGGRIVASRKTSYAEFVGAEDCEERVKQLMRAQHKAMFIALRDGDFDDPPASEAADDSEAEGIAEARPSSPPAVLIQPIRFCLGSSESDATSTAFDNDEGNSRGLYQATRPASALSARQSSPSPAHPPGGQERPVHEEPLDKVVLSYLASEPPNETDR